GQVASQTIESLYVTNASVSMPIFRPLIGMDKTEIIDLAQKISTFEISIRPYEDCCTIFVPKHPATKPKLEKVIEAEQKMEYQKYIDNFEEEVIEV
ncbi:MAG TPA: tRNA 4-thiouridine(8) synthase ThiI, partial [Thermoanaerobacter sp.]|nr:tRNA 4-thiouridine(8) synthase ThiI [Thermoanaerobacter sp.]